MALVHKLYTPIILAATLAVLGCSGSSARAPNNVDPNNVGYGRRVRQLVQVKRENNRITRQKSLQNQRERLRQFDEIFANIERQRLRQRREHDQIIRQKSLQNQQARLRQFDEILADIERQRLRQRQLAEERIRLQSRIWKSFF